MSCPPRRSYRCWPGSSPTETDPVNTMTATKQRNNVTSTLVPEEMRRTVPEPQTLMTGIVFGESPRWHEDRLWFSDWGTQEIVAVDFEGRSEVVVRMASSPFSIN
jgi:hypothetical protein